MRARRLPAAAWLAIAVAASPACRADPPAAASPAVAILVQQARYWREKGELDQARQAAERALRLAPNDAAALAIAAEIAASSGAADQADAYLARLRAASPRVRAAARKRVAGARRPHRAGGRRRRPRRRPGRQARRGRLGL